MAIDELQMSVGIDRSAIGMFDRHVLIGGLLVVWLGTYHFLRGVQNFPS